MIFQKWQSDLHFLSFWTQLTFTVWTKTVLQMSYSVICRKKETLGMRWELLNDRIYLFIYLFIIYLPVSLFTILFIYSFIHYLSICLCIYYLYIILFIDLLFLLIHSYIYFNFWVNRLFILLLKSQNCETNSELWRNKSHNCEIKTQLLDINSQLYHKNEITGTKVEMAISHVFLRIARCNLRVLRKKIWIVRKSEFIMSQFWGKARFNSELWKRVNCESQLFFILWLETNFHNYPFKKKVMQ